MTGSVSDRMDWQLHIRNKPRREALAQRFRDPADPFKIVIVRDMWLTGFDAPCLHTTYVDKSFGATAIRPTSRRRRRRPCWSRPS